MKRALLFLLVFLVVAAGIFAMVIGLNYSGFKTLFENEEGMAEGSQYIEHTYSLQGLTQFIGEHPEFISITSFNVSDPDSGIFYQQDTPRTLGTTANIFLLIEYERQVSEGLLDPEEIIQLEEIKVFALPEISENNHQKIIDEFKSGEAPLDAVVSAMIAYSDLAAADYVWFRLGEDNIRKMITSLSLSQTSFPVPFSGIYITINPSLNDTTGLSKLEYGDFANEAISAAKELKDDNEHNESVKKQFEDDRLSLTFIQERDALAHFPKSTTNEMAELLHRLVRGEIISPEVSEKIKDKLRWPMASEPIARSFEDYGSIYDNRIGLLGGIDFGTSIYDGHTSVQAIYFDRLPVAFWLHLSANHMQEDYQQRLIWDPALFETTLNEIKPEHE